MILKPKLITKIEPGHWASKGLIGSWIFNEGGGNLTYDTSGNSNHGTLVADVYSVPGLDGSALQFDGGTDKVQTEFNGTEYDDISFVAWAKIDAFSAGADYLLDNSPGTAGYAIRVFAEKIQFLCYSAGAHGQVESDTVVLKKWYQIVCTHSDAGNLIYLDSILHATTASSSGIDNSVNTFRIGMSVEGGSTGWIGPISSVLVYNRALTASEISDLYLDSYQMFKRGG